MTELKHTYYKQLQPGETHLFLKFNNQIPFYYQNKMKWIDYDTNISKLTFKNNEFMTNMLSITANETKLIYAKIKEIIGLLPGKYCLICSHFVNFKPHYIRLYYVLDMAFVILENYKIGIL